MATITIECVTDDLSAARAGDRDAFGRLVEPYLREIRAHCYRMLAGVQDAEDAAQDTLLSAWRAWESFEGRSSLRTWLYRIATNACLARLRGREARVVPGEHGPPFTSVADLGEPLDVPWLEPYPDDPATRYEAREAVELAFIAALQHLPGTQRAVLLLREVLMFSAAETAALMDTSVASVNSALQRARRSLRPGVEAAVPDAEARVLVDRFAEAWERADVDALVELLTVDALMVMPPLPAWFRGREAVAMFMAHALRASWRLLPARANGGPALAAYMERDGAYPLSGLMVPAVRDGRIAVVHSFLDPAVLAPFDLPKFFPLGR